MLRIQVQAQQHICCTRTALLQIEQIRHEIYLFLYLRNQKTSLLCYRDQYIHLVSWSAIAKHVAIVLALPKSTNPFVTLLVEKLSYNKWVRIIGHAS
jgi:hypothetical protein